MPSLDDIARSQTSLTPDDVAWLHALVADWQIIADLSFSDLVLWVPDAEAKGMWAGAQIRPTTGPTTLLEDVAGTFLPAPRTEPLETAMQTGQMGPVRLVELADGHRIRVELIPVSRAGRPIAVIARRSAESGLRSASALEAAYAQAAGELGEMIRRGEFPAPDSRSDLADSLRVGDGFVRTDAGGTVDYASPNAMSAYRRLGLVGDLVGTQLGRVTTGLMDRRPTERGARSLFAGEATEAELEGAAASLLVRVIPLRDAGRPSGSLILLRDVTELRLRERELVSKEATIREIHHRVKNNLQTVAALLRLQGRRMEIPEARSALDEAVRRVGSIALVHETLSQSYSDNVEFDVVADQLLRSVLDVAEESATPGRVTAERIGSFGLLPGAVATPLAMVLTELINNAATHAFAEGDDGALTLAVNRIRDRLRLRISDDGAGLPADFDPSSSLGLSIVATLVEGELHGALAFESRAAGGTTVAIALTV